MPTKPKRYATEREKAARAVAFAALFDAGASRLEIQGRLGLSRTEFYRLRASRLAGLRLEAETSRGCK